MVICHNLSLRQGYLLRLVNFTIWNKKNAVKAMSFRRIVAIFDVLYFH
jgi:hypothetical protein